MKMCSQDCLAKMKIVCLNTVQMLLKDAFHNFSKNLCNQSSIDLSSMNNLRSHSSDSQCKELNCSTQLTNSNSEQVTNQQQKATTSSTGSEEASGHAMNVNSDQNDQNSKDNLPNPLVLCNLMQNLVDAINDQCVKRLSPSTIVERKKRKRKRKRKKSKPSNDLAENEIFIDRSCSSNDACSKRQTKPNERHTARSQDKIIELDIQSSMPLSGPISKHNRCTQKSFVCNKFTNSKICSLDHTGNELSSATQMNQRTRHSLSERSSLPLVRSGDSHSHHRNQFSSEDKQSLKRKRNDTSDYKERKRITSARKPPTMYTRKDTSSCSERSRNDSDESSSSYSSSSGDE